MPFAARTRFAPSVMAELKSVTPREGAAEVSQAQRIPLALIDEDHAQPRRHFDEAALSQLAESIRIVGVLQPVGVQPAEGGRYLLRWGARRVRASQQAGLSDVPAVLVGPGQAGIEAQVMENAQRVSNSPAEIAAAIALMDARDLGNERIAAACALHPQELKHYRALDEVQGVPCLAACLDAGTPPRALYELWLVWQRADDARRERMADALAESPELTLAAARRVLAQTEAPAGVDAADTPVEAAAAEASSSASPTDGDTVAPKDAAPVERPARHRSAANPTQPSEDERERRVRTWLDTPRPRPRLTV